MSISRHKIRYQRSDGFTLFEMTVAISVFVIIMLMVVSIFQIVNEGQRNAIAAQNIQESLRYGLETMSKDIRMARRSDGSCKSLFAPSEPTPANKVYNTADADQSLYFLNKDGICTAYYLYDDQVLVSRELGSTYASVTPMQIKITKLKFDVTDNTFLPEALDVQPRVTISIEGQVIGKAINKQSIDIQTTISGRYYE